MNICPCCRSNQTLELHEENLIFCKACNHLKQNVIKPFKYDPKYIDSAYGKAPVTEMSYVRLTLTALYYQRITKKPLFYESNNKINILDYGCGNCEFVKAARDCNFNAFGYDIISGFDDLKIKNLTHKPAGSWDIVTFFDSLEHLLSLESVFLLDPKIFIVAIPDYSKSKEMIKNWKHYKPDEHLHYFSHKSIVTLFHRHNYRIFEISDAENLIRKKDITTFVFVRNEETKADK